MHIQQSIKEYTVQKNSHSFHIDVLESLAINIKSSSHSVLLVHEHRYTHFCNNWLESELSDNKIQYFI